MVSFCESIDTPECLNVVRIFRTLFCERFSWSILNFEAAKRKFVSRLDKALAAPSSKNKLTSSVPALLHQLQVNLYDKDNDINSFQNLNLIS